MATKTKLCFFQNNNTAPLILILILDKVLSVLKLQHCSFAVIISLPHPDACPALKHCKISMEAHCEQNTEKKITIL